MALMVPSSGIETWKSDSSSSRNASNSSSARSISSISSTGGVARRMAASRGRSSRYFSEKIWSSNYDVDTNLLDVYMSRLRAKLEAPGKPLFKTVRGVGYQLL